MHLFYSLIIMRILIYKLKMSNRQTIIKKYQIFRLSKNERKKLTKLSEIVHMVGEGELRFTKKTISEVNCFGPVGMNRYTPK